MLFKVKFKETSQRLAVNFKTSNQHFKFGFSNIQVVKDSHEIYEGDHTIIPSRAEQVMPTKNKLLTDNMTVKSIPFFQVDNNHGTTFIIGD